MIDRFVYMTDTHAKRNNIETRKDNYFKAIFKKLKWSLRYCNKNGITDVIHGGDLFDNPNVSDYVAGKIARLFKKAGVQLWYVMGNHDITGKNPESYVNGKLHMFESYDWFHFIGGECVEFNNCFLGGIDYTKEDEDEIHFNMPKKTEGKTKILVIHHMITGEKEDMVIGGKRLMTSYTSVDTDADIVLTGHFHPGMKIKKYHILERPVKIANPGSLSRTNKLIDKIGHGPALIDIKIKKNGKSILKHIPIPCKKNVFKKTIKKKYELEDYVDSKFHKVLSKFKNKHVIHEDIELLLRSMVGIKTELPFDIDDKLIDFIIDKVKEVKNGKSKNKR